MAKYAVRDQVATIHGSKAEITQVRQRNGVTEYELLFPNGTGAWGNMGTHKVWVEEEEISHKQKRYVRKVFGDQMRDLAHRKAPMGLSSGATGGYLVPQDFALVVDAGLYEASIFAANALTQPMISHEKRLPRVDITASHSTGSSPLFGGLSIGWVAEGASLPESEPSFADVVLTSKNGVALVYVSNNLVEDGGEALASYLEFVVPQAIAWTIDYKCFRGLGTNEPLGVLNSGALLAVTRAAANHIAQSDLADMIAALLPGCFNRAIWACHPTALGDVCNLSTFIVNAAGGMSIFGRPLFITEKLPALGTAGDILLFDPKLYALGARSMELAVSTTVRFTNYQTVFRFIWRGDGQPLVDGTATLADGTTTAGAFVSLGA